MRLRIGLLIGMLALPGMAFGQSMLNFPRAFTQADLGATGFALVNKTTSSAAVTFTMYSTTGTVVGTSAQTVAAGGQIARLGAELFPSASQPGWVQATSPVSGLQGFWLGGDFSTFTDGAEAAAEATDIIFALVAAQTEVNVANLGAGTNSVTFRLSGTAGTEMATATRSIPFGGIVKENASALFPSANLNDATHIRVTGSANIAGTAVISGYLVNPSWAVINAVSAGSTLTQANFPHVVSGALTGADYTTVVGVTNLASASQTVTLTFTPDSGSATTITRAIAANGSLRETAQNLFSLPSGFSNGWVRVQGTAALTGFVAYADSVSGGLAVVPVQATPRTTLLFAHIADLAPWLTGIALLNTNSSNATVDVYAMTPSGTLIAGADNATTARFTLNGGTKTAKLLSELIPQTQSRASDGGFVFVRSTQPLYGIELFFTRNVTVLANVAAGDGTGYTAPAAPQPLSLTSASPATLARGAALTLTGTGFATIAASNSVRFTTASGTVDQTPSAATAASITVTVPETAISGPVVVVSGGQTSSAVIVQVTATSATLAQNAVSVTSGAATSSVDIYVPAPAGSLNATGIGIFDVGSTSFSFGTSAVEITRGQTKELVVNGTGIASGTTLTISGSGITVNNFRYQGTLVIARITVDASTGTGSRNVIVTNSNLDTAVLTGGLFIR